MLKRINTKQLFYLSLVISCFFLIIFFNDYFTRPRFVEILIGFLGELLIIPMILIVLPVTFYISLKQVFNDRFLLKKYSFWSFLILLINLLLVWGSVIFFYSNKY